MAGQDEIIVGGYALGCKPLCKGLGMGLDEGFPNLPVGARKVFPLPLHGRAKVFRLRGVLCRKERREEG